MTDEALRVARIEPGSDPRWERFVAGHPEGLVFHHPRWLRLLERTYGELLCLGCQDAGGELRGILPLCATRGLPLGAGGPLSGKRLSSLPRTPTGGPLALDEAAARALVAAALEEVERRPGVSLELKPPPSTPLEGPGRIRWGTSFVVALPESASELRLGNARNHAAVLRAVRKAESEGVRVRAAETHAELRAWYRLYLETMRHHVLPPRPYSFFADMWDALRPSGMLRLLLAERAVGGRRRLIAGSVMLMGGRTVVFADNGRRAADLPSRPNEAIHWRAMQDAIAEGYQRYDLGEVQPGHPGLDRFKRKWGAEPRPLHRLYPLSPAPASDDPPVVAPEDGWRQRAWRRLPLPATAIAGRLVYRYL